MGLTHGRHRCRFDLDAVAASVIVVLIKVIFRWMRIELQESDIARRVFDAHYVIRNVSPAVFTLVEYTDEPGIADLKECSVVLVDRSA